MTCGKQWIDAIQNIIAEYDTDLDRNTALASDFENRVAAAFGIYTATIRDDLDVLFHDIWQDLIDHIDKIARVAHAWVTQLLFLHNGHRHFGEIVHHHVIERRF